uniref:LAGLIDADG endonuclease n=1 Tax=Orbilia oligospora TaxID=2813651 RepID=A0A6G6A3P3_ORBOL|nr:LAGLIDADG endonuclease [Orbilia oligospora]
MYPLISQKYSDYIVFKKTFELITRGDHLIDTGWDKLLSIKATINKGLSDELIKTFPHIIAIKRPLVTFIKITPEWFAGLTFGEGCFMVNIFKNSSQTKFKTMLIFKINQHVRDKVLLESFINFFNCGMVVKHFSNAVIYVVSNRSDINEKIIS